MKKNKILVFITILIFQFCLSIVSYAGLESTQPVNKFANIDTKKLNEVLKNSDPTKKAADGAFKKFEKFMNSSAGVLVLAGISAGYSGILWSSAAKQVDQAHSNMDKLDKTMASFKDSWVGFCPKGRDDLSQADCYCYLDNGKQNPDRTNSQTCLDLWSKNSYKVTSNAGDYSGSRKPIDPVGCLNVNGQFDEKCTCKKFVDAKGNNACAKTTSLTLPNNSFSAGFVGNTGINDFLKFANNTANGNPGIGLLNAGQMSNQAISGGKMLQAMLSQLTSKKEFANTTIANEKNSLQLAKAILGEKNIAAAMATSKSPLSIASGGSSDPKNAELLGAAAAKAGLVEMVGSGHGLANKKEEKKDGMNFNFTGDSANGSNVQAQNFPEAQKNYNYKDSDINKQPDTSIFDIISNRYIQSGLKRLFDN